MLKNRVIPCLLLDEGRLVKSTKFKNNKYVGDPINAIKIFNDKEVDELIVIDISATRLGRGPNYSLIEEFAGECFMPLCYGGGVKSIEQARRLFNSGVEKISIQSALYENENLLNEIVSEYGSQSIVASVDLKKNIFGKYRLYDFKSKGFYNLNWHDYIKKLNKEGVGEIFLNFVDRDGCGNGLDLELIREVSSLVSVPLIACGGVGSLDDIKSGVDAGANAIAAGSYFVFNGPHKAVLITYPKYNELSKLFEE